jgi:hypothetical protein
MNGTNKRVERVAESRAPRARVEFLKEPST